LSRATYLRRPGESEKHLYVIGRILDGEWSRVLCVTSASGARTLPVFSHREAARRFLRASPLRFNLLGSGWRTKEISESEAGAVLAGSPGGIQGITLDPSPEALVGECGAEPLARKTWSPSRVYSEVAGRQ
jgi:hypothetical protein